MTKSFQNVRLLQMSIKCPNMNDVDLERWKERIMNWPVEMERLYRFRQFESKNSLLLQLG
jgi:hypothetical protein